MSKNIDIKSIKAYYQNRKRLPMGNHRFFSVLVPFVEIEKEDGKKGEKELCLLFEERANGNIMAPGEICFPGGHMETDESAGRCAIRETEEELGIPGDRIRFIGRGDTLRGFSNYTLYTTIGFIDYEDYLCMKPELSEVAEGFLVRVSQFLDNEPYVYESEVIADRTDFPYELAGITPDYPWSVGKWDTVVYNVEDTNGKHRIVWGITGGIVRHVMDQLTEITDDYR